jgi:membrane-bound metal-dependent hydrolase YbcI (DUF457 family)
MALLVYAPVAYLLITDGNLTVAVLGWLGIHVIEPLPDSDFGMPGLNHRGVSHSLLAVVVVGGALGAGGWFLGDRVFEWLYALFSAGGDVWGWLLSRLPDLSASLLAGIVPNIPPGEIVATIQQQAGGTVDRRGFAMFGFAVGAGGILVHLLGDMITTEGIKPFLPVSGWRLSLSSLRADSPAANSGLFGLGVLAIAVVLVATVPGAVLGAGLPTDFAPVGVAAGQDSGAQNGSVTINRTESNRTQIELSSLVLPKNGYVVARTGNVSENQSTTVVGRTRYVRHGNYSGVILNLSESINTSQVVSVTIHNDTNGNETWDGAKTDTPYLTSGETPVHDTVRLSVNGSESTTQPQNTTSTNATVSFSNQTTNGSSVTVERATLAQPGFVAIHTSSYADGLVGPNESIIAVSQRLSAGTHHNVSVNISHAPPGNAPGLNRSRVNGTSTLAATVYGDTNRNKQLDSVRSLGENDTLITRNGSVVRDTARVRVPTPPRQTASVAIDNQTLRNNTVVVERARLPDGGFVVALNASYQRSGDPLASVVGVSDYLSSGKHTNVTLDVSPGALGRTQVVTIQPARDTNGNQRYDYVRSQGFRDVAYENRSGSQSRVVTASALVRPGFRQATQMSTETPAQTTPTATTAAGASPTTAARGDVKGSDAPLGLSWLQFGIGVVVVIVVLPTVIRRVR